MPLFAILLPVLRPPALLPFAIESVLAQTVADFELLVVCDGAPAETVACAESYARRDARVKVHAHPKGERHGEAYRHQALAQSNARYVAHLCDDDLWFPNFLAELEILLSAVDFGNLLHSYVRPGGAIEILPGDLGRPDMRQRMLTERCNLFGPTFAGYRMEAYRRLPEGWAPGPAGLWTDLNMWRKFLRETGLTFGTRAAVAALHFATPEREDATLTQRAEENRTWLGRIGDPRERNEIVQAAWRSLLDVIARKELETAELVRSRALIGDLQAALAQTAAARDQHQAELERIRLAHDTLQASFVQAAAVRDAVQAELHQAMRERDQDRAESETSKQALAETRTELARVLNSKSWRLTAPLRRLMAMSRRAR